MASTATGTTKRGPGRPRKPEPQVQVKVAVASERVIRKGEAYPLTEFQRRTGLGEKSIRRMEREGFRTLIVGRTKQIRGEDYLAYLDRLAEQSASHG